ncbi:hypothetical protein [Blastococcus sp. TBT05-19]|nr:hypothetical protein [Blastococcus sp. TBT05-19]
MTRSTPAADHLRVGPAGSLSYAPAQRLTMTTADARTMPGITPLEATP